MIINKKQEFIIMTMTKYQRGILVAVIGFMAICIDAMAGQSQANSGTSSVLATIIKSPNDDRQYKAITLSNGMDVVLVSDPSLESAAVSLVVGVGSAQDPNEQLGLAHYLEHMLFLGTKKYPEQNGFMKFTQANGGMANAFTAFTRTNYMFQINAGKLDESLDRFSDYFKSPTFDAQFSDKERHAVNNEWSMQKGQDNFNLFALQGVTANPKHPISRFSIGNLETLVDKIDSKLIDEMKKFYESYYSANIMKLTLVSKQGLPELQALVEKNFSSIVNKKIEMPVIKTRGITKKEMGLAIHYRPIRDLSAIFVDYPIDSNKHQWQFKANEYLYHLLTSEDKGTLGEELRARGWIKNMTAFVQSDSFGKDGYYRIVVELTDTGLPHKDDVVASIFSYIDKIKKEGLSESYYLELQSMRSKDFSSAMKPDPLQQAVALSMAQFELPIENLLNSSAVFSPYNEKHIKHLLNQLEEKKARIWFISPSESVDTAIPHLDGRYKINKISSDQYKKWRQLKSQFSFSLPQLNDLFSDKTADIVKSDLLKPSLILSQAGIEAYLVHPEFYAEDKGRLSLQLNVDFALASPREAILAHLLNHIFSKQLVGLSDRAARASLFVSTSVMDVNSQGIYIGGYTEKHAQLLEQTLTIFSNLDVSDEAFHEALNNFKTNLQNQKKSPPFQQLLADMQRMQYRDQWSNDVLLGASDKIQKSDLITYHQRVKDKALLRLYAAGNYSQEQVKAIALNAASILPSKTLPNSRSVNQYILPPVGKIIELKSDSELADNALLQGWFGKQKSDDELAQLIVLNALFANAFFTQLRTNEQLGYIVNSSIFPVDDVAGFVMWVQSSSADVVSIKARMDKFRLDYLPVLMEVPDVAIDQIKMSIVANIMQKPTDLYADVDRYSSEFWHAKYQFNKRDRLLAALKKVTKKDVIQVYKNIVLSNQSPQYLFQMRGKPFIDKPFAKAD